MSGGSMQTDTVVDNLRDEFLEREVTYAGANGETRFVITKMPSTRGWDVLEEIREAAVNGPMNSMSDGSIQGVISALVMALPKPFVRQLRNIMFSYVTFTNRVAATPMVLAGNEETAFDLIEAEPIVIHYMLLRALAVNFTPSFTDLFGKISALLTSIGSPLNIENSPASSLLQ